MNTESKKSTPKLTEAQRRALAYQSDPDANERFARRKISTMNELIGMGLVVETNMRACFWDDFEITDAGRAALRGE